MGRKKIWTLHLGLSFSWRMPLKTRRTSQNNPKSQGLWSTDFCPQILASSFQVKFAVSPTTCGFSHRITIINICKVLWDSAMKILTVKRRAEHPFSAPCWLLLLAFCPQSSNTMFSFDFLLTKSKVLLCRRWHKSKRSFCRAVKEGCIGKHEDVFWKDEWSRAPEKDEYLLPSYIRKLVPHADSYAQNYAGGFR